MGVDRIKVQVVEDIFPFEFNKAVADNKLEVATQPSIEAFNFELGKDLTITAKVELKPEVELGQYKDLTIEFEQYTVPDNALEL